MKPAPNSNRKIRAVILAVMLLTVTVPCYAVERLQIESGTDPGYLPYYLDSLRSTDLSRVDVKLGRAIQPFAVTEGELDPLITLVLAQNPEAKSPDRSRFSTYGYDPAWQIANEYPVPYAITSWLICRDSSTNTQILASVGRARDGIYVGRHIFQEDSVSAARRRIMTRDDHPEPDDWLVRARIFAIADYDMDEHQEVFAYVSGNPKRRRLFCIDLTTLEIEWELDVASPILKVELVEDSIDSRVVLVASNPCNGARDSNFVDWFQYFAVLNNRGEILNSRIIGSTYQHSIGFCAAPEPGFFFLAHALYYPDSASIPDSVDPGHRISLIDSDGQIHRSAPHEATPDQVALVPFGDDALPHVWVRSRSGSVTIYSLELDEVAYCENTTIGEYLGEISIRGEEKTLFVFKDGLYDRDFSKVLQFPFLALSVSPLAYDSLGYATDIVLNRVGYSYIGRITKKNLTDLISVFYHRNQVYVLMALSGLLVGLIVTNVFRRRARENLLLIAKQKSELEQTHHELVETQEKLVAAEKYKQAKDIAGGFAHEIRNALFPADGLLTKLRRTSDPASIGPDQLRSYHKDTQAAISRAIGITELISLYTKLDSEYLPEPTNLVSVVRDGVDANRLRIENQCVTIDLPGVEQAIVSVNRSQAEIVVNNLLLNSLDALAGTSNGRITIDIESDNDQVCLKFADNGEGIEPDKSARIFDTFYSTKPENGLGLGLSMVKRIVEMYDGEISVTSDAGEGTVFTLRWPEVGKEAT